MIKILAGSVCYRSKISVDQAFFWLDLGAAAEAMQDKFDISGFQYTDFCSAHFMRNNLIQSAITSNVHWLVMMDPDYHLYPTKTSQPGSDLFNMIRLGEEQQAAVVAASLQPQVRFGDEFEALGPGNTSPRVVDRIGLGISVINVQWIMNEWPVPPWFKSSVRRDPENPEGFSFDPSETFFCDGVRKRNGLILCDPRVGFGQRINGQLKQ